MKIKLLVEDEGFRSSEEVYLKIIDILQTAQSYDKTTHDILATIEEVNKYLKPLEYLMEEKEAIK